MTNSPLLQLPNTYRAFYGAFASLHPFQRDVIAPILQGQDVILQAATGSGKTEAVVAPCLERVIRTHGVEAVLYVVPTRALVHDLRRRLAPVMGERLGLRLGLRTGDAKHLPAGQADMILTTPESLDVMLGSPNRELQAFLQRVTMLIIDEAHQLIEGYRGRHLRYVLQRLARRSHRRLHKIALSATLAGPEAIRTALGLQPDAVWVTSGVQRQIQPHLIHLQQEDQELVAFLDDLAGRFGLRKLLLFANSRSRCDRLFALLRQHGYFQQATYLHYSNLKRHQRQEVERQFQRRTQALCIATSTLELGIDVGDVDSVLLYEPPANVTTFLQRLGRANRKARTTTFWGICRGPQAGEQLLQFLALYSLAQEGAIEAMQPMNLPSVLVQQVLSCLYEHKQVSLAALQALFPDQAETLATLLPALETRQWLRPTSQPGRDAPWRGGWRYARALRQHQIWSNFPDTEVPYILEVEAQAVADVPTSVVRQLELGDEVNLAGRCIRILDIQDGERKVVRAMPVDASDTKELVWMGSGPPVSWEVAQAVRPLLQPAYVPDAALAAGLFARPRTLLQRQRQRAERLVVLHNGMELSRTPLGLYRYATYLGSVGNFVLQQTLTTYYGSRLEDFACSADALAVTCSDRINWQRVPLPIGREAFRQWAGQYLWALQGLFAFNTFSRALPRVLLVEEATDFLWDERLSQAFAHYHQRTSEIAQGDPQHLEWDDTLCEEAAQQPATTVIRQGPQPTILAQEKARLGLLAGAAPVLPKVPDLHRTPRALTGTMVGSYIQHRQCDRLLSFDLLPFAQQPPKRALVDSALGAARAGQGRTFEEEVLAYLEHQGVALYRIPERDAVGMPLSLRERQERSVACLSALLRAHAGQRADTAAPRLLGALVQAVLVLPGLVEPDAADGMAVDGVGIPDLIEITVAAGQVQLTIADIKDSATPRYSQQWQVAFYTALLRECLPHYALPAPVQVDDHGVLFTRPAAPEPAPTRHTFDLTPYLAAWVLLQQRTTNLLATPPLQASWQLQAHCSTCAYLDTCYRQALSTDDIMLVPQLTPGEHVKLRTAGLHTLGQAADWRARAAQDDDVPLSAQQATSLRARIRALVDNRVEVRTETTALYPANISTAVFVHLLRDPQSGQPRAWGLHRLPASGAPETAPCWVAATAEDILPCQQAFVTHLRGWWQEAIAASRGPHLFTFGARSLRLLREATDDTLEPGALDFLWTGDPPRHTDLQQVLTRHFVLPIPLRSNLATLAQVWGLAADLMPPSSLLQDEAEEVDDLLLSNCLSPDHITHLQHYLWTHLTLQQQLWQRCATHLRSDCEQHDWRAPQSDLERPREQAYVTFLEQQQHWRQQDILAVQQLPLAERAERYRVLGPLAFDATALDSEGRFLHHFRLPPESSPARFRRGDFLKLNPVGSPDLQAGADVILAQYEPHAQRLAVIPRQGHPTLTARLRYTLDEDLADWTTPRVVHAVREACAPGKSPHVMALLAGTLPLQQPTSGLAWAQHWLRQVELNARQQEALLLPFHARLGLVEGPPGTGKTHLLAWMLIALTLEAYQAGRPLRLVVSALTHQAIDNVLFKVQQLLTSQAAQNFPGHCLKWGRQVSLAKDDVPSPALAYTESAEEVLQAPYVILGATGFGLYRLFDSQSGHFPAFFDWVIFDEASQVVLPQAMLSLIYGKGQYIFCGDVQQLPPVVRGPQTTDGEAMPERSILAHLLATYDPAVRVRLNETYRLNQELCALPSRLWYQGDLRPAAANAASRLTCPVVQHPDVIDAILAPQRPVTLVLATHTTDHQRSAQEVDIIARLAVRLLLTYGVAASAMAIIAPHRAQNNAIAQRLAHLLTASQPDTAPTLPVIDTVERLQGAERDVVLFSLTTSDPDHLDSPFLNNPQRLNVAITRARHKLVVVGSQALFTQVPQTDASLHAHHGFLAYYHLCRAHNALFHWAAAAAAA